MEKNKKSILTIKFNIYGIIALFLLCSCSGIRTKENVRSEERVVPKNVKLKKVYVFYCGNDSISVEKRWIYRIPDKMMSCLINTGYEGNSSSNQQIAKIIRLINHGGEFRAVFPQETSFRGKEIFEALLYLETNEDCNLSSFSGGCLEETKTMVMIYKLFHMIKSINGMEFNANSSEMFESFIKGDMQTLQLENLEKGILPYVTTSRLWHESFKKAWESGMIVLKDYGEE